jgi:uncharacterized protein (DUF4415 family)
MSLNKRQAETIRQMLRELPEPDLTDPDNPEWTEEDFARAVKVEDLPEAEREMIYAAFPNTPRRRGPNKRPRKVLLSLRLDPEVVDRYRATGEGWQALMNADLAEASKRHAGK